MIVPGNRLLVWTGMVFVSAGLLYAAQPDLAMPALGVCVAFAALAALDSALLIGSLDEVQAVLPSLVRLTKGREGTIDVDISNPTQKARRLALGLAFPRSISATQEVLRVELPAGRAVLRTAWPCTALERGNYRLDRVYLETPSPLGFWRLRGSNPIDSEIRVYPNLLPDQKNLAAMFLNRGNVGIHSQRQVGRGRDFEKLREYIPGDGFDEIHWKATAKRHRPVTKVFQIERTQEVYLVLDASRLSARASIDRDQTVVTQFERFVTSALVLGQVAERQGDLYGMLAFSDKVLRFVRARAGKLHYGACRDALYALEPEVVNPDFEEVCSFIRLRLRRRALLLFLTNLDDPVLAENFVRSVELIARQHLVLVSMPTPPGVKPIFSGPAPESMNELYAALGGHFRWASLHEVRQVLQRRGIAFNLLDRERMCPELVTQYLNVKQRQAL